ncbi:MAG: hypothetical protein KBB14_18000 [Thermoanaerobaculia bacterium]|nr:hypothetical protein [Thermoanaerobaculia bacterium]
MTRRSLSLALALGLLGGLVLALSHAFFTPGKYILLPWAAVVLGSVVAIRADSIANLSERFTVGFVAFAVSSIALYAAVLFSPGVHSVGLLGHAWRIGVLLAIGALLNLVTAPLSRPAPAHSPQAA